MKITKQQIDIIATAMAKELSDTTKAYEEAKKAAAPYIKSAKKSKFYKEAEQVFKMWWVKWINIYDKELAKFCPEVLWDISNGWHSNYDSLKELDNTLENRIVSRLTKKLPSEYQIKDKIVLELTLKSLGCDDIYEVLDEVKSAIKKEFNI